MKRFVKLIAYFLSYIYFFFSKLTGFYMMSLHLSKYTFLGEQLRYYFYLKTIKEVGKNVKFSYGVIFTHTDIKIGNNVRFGPYNTIGLVDFNDNVLIGQNVHFLSGKEQHRFDNLDLPINKQAGIQRKIVIGEDCWIGAGSVIMDSIGEKSIIGAGSVVTKPFEQGYCILVGNPAKEIKKRINEKSFNS